MKKSIVILLTLSVVILLIACSENSNARSENSISKLHWESHDGIWALNSLDESIPEILRHELKASPFEIAKTKNHWESRDGAWAIGAEPLKVAEATVSRLHWESHDGIWAINNLDSSISDIPSDERKASPFFIANTKDHWESMDGAWAIGAEPLKVAEATVSRLHWESHDGIWTINNLDNNISDIPSDERKASPFEMAKTNHHWESHNGYWTINTLDSSTPEIPSSELKASPFDIANNKYHWESRDGAWAIGTEPIKVAEATIEAN